MDARTLGAVAAALVLTACTGPPDGGAERLPMPDGPGTSLTAGPTAQPPDAVPTAVPDDVALAELLTEAADFVPTTHPALLAVTREGFAGVADDAAVDRSRLVPPLPGDHVWKCFTGPTAGTVVCLGLADADRFETAPGPSCPAGALERHRLGRSLVTHRTHGPGGRLTQRITHETYQEHHALPGSDRHTEGGSDVFVVDDLAPDGTVRTRRIIGTESYEHTLAGALISLDHGELLVQDPGGEPQVRIVTGRWDRLQDPAGAHARLCAAFE